VDDILDDGRIEDETLEEARKMFSERELVELTWVQASETYFNMQAHPLGIPSDGLAAIARRASP
jgi:alkylhydroperoxidase family enzyme